MLHAVSNVKDFQIIDFHFETLTDFLSDKKKMVYGIIMAINTKFAKRLSA